MGRRPRGGPGDSASQSVAPLVSIAKSPFGTLQLAREQAQNDRNAQNALGSGDEANP